MADDRKPWSRPVVWEWWGFTHRSGPVKTVVTPHDLTNDEFVVACRMHCGVPPARPRDDMGDAFAYMLTARATVLGVDPASGDDYGAEVEAVTHADGRLEILGVRYHER